jgi:23S rRNA pseudouridine1911/1915/1917 synthase
MILGGEHRFYHALRAVSPASAVAPLAMSRLRASDVTFVRPAGVDEAAIVSVFRVPPEVAGQRLDVFVHSQLHRTSRTRAQAIVKASAYDAHGRKLSPNDRVRPEQQVLLWRAPWDETPVPVRIPILYEDDHLLAVDKPALLPVHPSARYYRNTLIKILKDARTEAPFLSLGHRLDRETSGILLVSKTRACDRALKRQLEERVGVEKWYTAITWGVPDRGDGAAAFRYCQPVALDPTSPLRIKMCATDEPGALHAATHVEVADVRRSGGERGRTYALVRCGLETGRQHQIRVHLASLGAPVVGDKLYGPDDRVFARAADGQLTPEDAARLELPRHALHASRLSLLHPIERTPLAFESPMPDDMADFWQQLAGDPNGCLNETRQSPRGTLSSSS